MQAASTACPRAVAEPATPNKAALTCVPGLFLLCSPLCTCVMGLHCGSDWGPQSHWLGLACPQASMRQDAAGWHQGLLSLQPGTAIPSACPGVSRYGLWLGLPGGQGLG